MNRHGHDVRRRQGEPDLRARVERIGRIAHKSEGSGQFAIGHATWAGTDQADGANVQATAVVVGQAVRLGLQRVWAVGRVTEKGVHPHVATGVAVAGQGSSPVATVVAVDVAAGYVPGTGLVHRQQTADAVTKSDDVAVEDQIGYVEDLNLGVTGLAGIVGDG